MAKARDGDRFIWPEYDGRRLIAFPAPGDLPVVVAARMSLSFPFLISAIPLYRIDWPTKQADGKAVKDNKAFMDFFSKFIYTPIPDHASVKSL